MATRMMSKVALATAAAAVLYVPTLGLPLPDSCPWTGSVAGAAPSPSCGGDLRECLRASARTGLYGVRYVTADDVARCMEAFRSCMHGGASRGGNASPTKGTPPGEGSGSGSTQSTGLPTHFGVNGEGHAYDCRTRGGTVNCTFTLEPPSENYESYTGTITGTLSGLTVTGTSTTSMTSVPSGDCVHKTTLSAPITFTFNPDGTVAMQTGPTELNGTASGSTCSGGGSTTWPPKESTGTWSPIN